MKRIAGLVLALIIVLALVPMAVCAGDSGEVTGTFGTSYVPTITVALRNVTNTSDVTEMTPTTNYNVAVTVEDADTLEDISSIVAKVWYDENGGDPTEAEFNAATADAQKGIIITWTPPDTCEISPTGTTWKLGDCTTPTLTETSGTFLFNFTVGKVATETAGSAKWQIAANVTDKGDMTDWAFYSGGSTMNWYGEITVPSGITVDWGPVAPGTGFELTRQPVDGTITYISNGGYDAKVASSPTWSGTIGENVATLDGDGSCDNPKEFALKADETDVLPVGDSNLVTTGGVTISSRDITDETGDIISDNYLWLNLASTFAKDTYSGTITYSIST